MACVHLQQLYQLCQQHHLKLSSSDLVHIVCDQCGKQEVCPSNLMERQSATNGVTANSAAFDPDADPASRPERR